LEKPTSSRSWTRVQFPPPPLFEGPAPAGPSSFLDSFAVVLFAHAGHILLDLLYALPLLVMIVLLVIGKLRERRERD
jgi:hypothetical protein